MKPTPTQRLIYQWQLEAKCLPENVIKLAVANLSTDLPLGIGELIREGFVWEDTPQGHNFWADIEIQYFDHDGFFGRQP